MTSWYTQAESAWLVSQAPVGVQTVWSNVLSVYSQRRLVGALLVGRVSVLAACGCRACLGLRA